MPAKSKAQQKAAGAALSAKRGDTPKSELKGASKSMMSMSEKELEKKISGMQAESAGNLAKDLAANARDVKGVPVVTHVIREGGAEALKVLGERLKDRLPRAVIALGAIDQAAGKASLQVLVTGDLSKTHSAGKLVQAAAPLIEGKGGGKPEQAQAGGPKISGLEPALAHIVSLLG